MGLFKRFSADIGIDLGTCNTIIYIKGKGIVVNEPSVVAVERGTKSVVAVGAEAKRMLWRTPGNIIAIRPLKDGVIADKDTTEKMIRYFISKILPRHRLIKPRMVIGIPSCITDVESSAVHESALKAGAGSVEVLEESLAAAIGANIPITEPAGNMVCDIGGGTTEVGVMSLSGMVYSHSVRVGGDAFDEAIINYVRRNYGMLIGESTAESIKKEIGTAFPGMEVKEIEVKGHNVAEGIPRSFTISSNEILEAITEPINQIVQSVKTALEKTPPELGADIAERGLVLTGGGALLKGLDRLLAEETGLPVMIAEDPLTCVARGTGRALDLIGRLNSIFVPNP